MNKHTPGPWVADEYRGIITSANGIRIAELRSWGKLSIGPHGEEEFMSNARLIAAAPEMLDAIRAHCEECEYFSASDAARCRECKFKEILKKVEGI